jgi:deoxycytidylate deaminase
MALNFIPTDYATDSDNDLVNEVLAAKRRHARTVRGYGPLSCWAGVIYRARGTKHLMFGCSQDHNHIDGTSPYKNQYVKYHGEIAAIANAIETINEGSYGGGDIPVGPIYIELSPCDRCGDALKNLLPDQTDVYYSFDYATEMDAWEQAAKGLCSE